MIVLVDLDGTTCKFVEEVLYRYNNDYNDNLTPANITQYGLHECVKPECGRLIYKYFHDRGIFSDLALIEGAKEGITEILSKGSQVCFVTKPVGHSLSCVAEKQSWVDKHFPEIGSDNMVFTSQKHRVIGNYLIDDMPENHKLFNGKRILFDQPWNQEKCGHIDYRAVSWKEITDYLLDNN